MKKQTQHPSFAFTGLLAFAVATVAVADARSTPQPVYSENFAAATARDTWYSSGAASTVPYDAEAKAINLTALNAGSGKHVLTYFDSTSLGIGEKLTLNLVFSVSGTTGGPVSGVTGATDQLRFGLFNSGANGHVSKDNHGTSGTSTTNGITDGFGSYVGYSPTITFGNGNGSLGLRERNAINNQLLTAANAYTGFTSGGNDLTTDLVASASKPLASGHTCNISYTLTRAATDIMTMSMNISGTDSTGAAFSYTISGADKTGIVSTFDTFAISVNNSAVDFLINSVTITHTIAPVPEPGAVALLAGLAGLLGASLNRLADQKSDNPVKPRQRRGGRDLL
ncbi:MAG: hypothetical protein LBK99_16795 [Opitutaceae bacterium]|jgi:hypothetical protein|nr:hypothetical protein [Opitutaceae bacterium]